MDRLTSKYRGGYGLVKVKNDEQEIESPYPNTLRACFESWQRLGAYEDTGLMPDEIAGTVALMQHRVLTLDEVIALNGCPVWCEDRNGSGAWALVDNGEDKCFDADYGDWEFYCYGWTNERGWRAWTSKPTDEERKAEAWKDD